MYYELAATRGAMLQAFVVKSPTAVQKVYEDIRIAESIQESLSDSEETAAAMSTLTVALKKDTMVGSTCLKVSKAAKHCRCKRQAKRKKKEKRK
ncbi:hypothetical protein PV325_009408 [Microctonus aethiopoides]|nr:hypothetical protein PV325_009408 [Microctonus aethiopoides]